MLIVGPQYAVVTGRPREDNTVNRRHEGGAAEDHDTVERRPF